MYATLRLITRLQGDFESVLSFMSDLDGRLIQERMEEVRACMEALRGELQTVNSQNLASLATSIMRCGELCVAVEELGQMMSRITGIRQPMIASPMHTCSRKFCEMSNVHGCTL